MKILVHGIATNESAELESVRPNKGRPHCLPVALSPDGNEVVFGTTDGGVHLWEWRSGNPIRDFAGRHEGSVNAVAFSPDGIYAASGSSGAVPRSAGTARVWNVQTGAEVKVLTGHRAELTSVVFSPNGKFLVTACGLPGGGYDGTALVWDLATWSKTELRGRDRIGAVAISPDSRFIGTAHGDNLAHLWQPNGNEYAELRGHSNWVKSQA